jgi:hypothetical protein
MKTAIHLPILEDTVEEILRRVKNWPDLELAARKTEALFFTRKKKIIPLKIVLNGYKVPSPYILTS